MTEQIAVKIENLTKRFRKFALDDISLTLPEGNILGLIGPNGAGKTTTIKILMDMVKADSGKIQIFGRDHEKNIREIKNRIGYVGENQFFYGDKTVAWTGNFVSAFFRQWDINLFQTLLSQFNLSRSKKTKELSKGMRVKFSLALAMAHHPDLYILDEPTAGLDPVIRREVLELLLNLSKDEGKSVLISSHITDDLSRIADLVAFLINGKLVMLDEKDEILSRWKRIHFLNDLSDKKLSRELYCLRSHQFGKSGITDRFPSLKPSLEEEIAHESVKIENIDLDEILIALVKGK